MKKLEDIERLKIEIDRIIKLEAAGINSSAALRELKPIVLETLRRE